MSDALPDPPDAAAEAGVERHPQPVWLNPPRDMVPGVLPVALVIGRSAQAVVMLTGMRVFTTGIAMGLGVRTRSTDPGFSPSEDVFGDGPDRPDQDGAGRRDRLTWGCQLADGRRATNTDSWSWPRADDPSWVPGVPVLSGGGGSGNEHATDREYWLWPLPPGGALTIFCQWPRLGIEPTSTPMDAEQVVAAAARARPLWTPS